MATSRVESGKVIGAGIFRLYLRLYLCAVARSPGVGMIVRYRTEMDLRMRFDHPMFELPTKENEMLKEIADAFGLQPDSLEGVVDDEPLAKLGHCQSCAGWAKKYAELEAVLSARDASNRNASPGQSAPWESEDFSV